MAARDHITPKARCASVPLPLPIPPLPRPPAPLPEPPDDERAPVVVAFPPTPSEAAGVADAIERLPPGSLLSFARSSLISAHRHQADPIYATANLHAVFGAMLALCRVLDAAAYPWDGADRRRARA